MIRGSKKRTLNHIGKKTYDFDFSIEKEIYRYVCYQKVKRKEQKKINCFKFNSYAEWKKYVVGKYESYDVNELMEFSRYLNLRTRNIKPWQEYWKIVTSVCLATFISKMTEEFVKVITKNNNIAFPFYMILCFLCIIIMGVALFAIIWQTIKPFLDDSTEENMLIDYKEIIDEIIEEKSADVREKSC